jgi:hypothetical protein
MVNFELQTFLPSDMDGCDFWTVCIGALTPRETAGEPQSECLVWRADKYL